MDISEIAPNVDRIEFEGRTFYLIGTAHVSKQSAELVESSIREYKPDVVCVELCEPRLQALRNPESWRETDIFHIIKTGKAYVLFSQLILSSFQRRLAKKFGIEPGEEMRRALKVADELGCEIAVVDREIRITLKRAWAQAGFWSLTKVICSLIASVFVDSGDVSEAEIEQLKEGDALSAMMAEFSEFLPGVKSALIDERDRYMATKILQTKGNTVLAVLGAGHIPGMKQVFGSDIDLKALEVIPPKSTTLRMIAWGIPLLIISMFIYGFYRAGSEIGMEMISAWFIANGVFSGIGAALAFAHPLTILTAVIAAPFTSLNPTIAAGWVCGLVEAFIRKPRVKDLETIADDIVTFKGFWNNRVTKILLVVIFANLGSVVGTFVGWLKVASLLPW